MEGSLESERVKHEQFVKPIDLLRWIEDQDAQTRVRIVQANFDSLLAKSSHAKSEAITACVKLCGFVECCTKSQVLEIQQWSFSHSVSLSLFNFFIEWNEVEQHRSMRLVLDLLPTLITKNISPDVGGSIKTDIVDTLVSIVGRKSTRPLVKSSLKALDQFTAKKLFTVEEIGESYKRVHSTEQWESSLDLWDDIFAQLFLRMALYYIRAIAGRCIVTLYQAVCRAPPGVVQGKNGEPFTLDVWLAWLQAGLVTTPTLMDSIKNYVFLPLFKDDKAQSLQLLQQMATIDALSPTSGDNVSQEALLRFTALEVGKKVGIVDEPDPEAAPSKSCVVLEEGLLNAVLSHPAPEVRSLALSLVVSSNSTTKPFSEPSLHLLKAHLPHFFADPSPRFRMELLSKLKTLYRRIRGAIPVLRKAIERLDSIESQGTAPKGNISQAIEATRTWSRDRLQRSRDQHVQFLTWLILFLKSELIPTASYQRHYSVLRATLVIMTEELAEGKIWDSSTGDFPFFDQFDTRWTRALFDLIMDPFEDVRSTSTEILKLLFSDERFSKALGSKTAADIIAEFLARADALAKRTSRADHSDGVARCYELLCRFRETQAERLLVGASLIDLLEGKLSIAELDLGRAVLEAPVHSYFASLRFVWQTTIRGKYSEAELESLSSLQDRMIKCCERIWDAVRYVLCDDSPEGHLPQELEDAEGLDTKDVLSYSFRAVHEASNLMRTVVLALKATPQADVFRPSVDVFAAVGNLTFDQLASLRHRGAFSTVSLTFATCCQLVKHLGEDHGRFSPGTSFLDHWYEASRKCIMTHASTTRRSAGIPSMITGILSADPTSPPFEQVIQDLTDIAKKEAFVSETDGSNLPQVHALNSLKDVMKNSQLAQTGKVEPHIPQCLELAAGCLKSEVWAIRNSGLLLLRSLIDSLFGTNESKATIDAGWDGRATRLRYHQYPILPEVLLSLLRSGQAVMKPSTGNIAAESVFPALDIIRRAGPPEALRDELHILVAGYLGSSVWHVRDMAARALCSFMLHDDWVPALTTVIFGDGQAYSSLPANRLHGVLLTAKYIFERLTDVSPDLARRDVPRLLDLLIRVYEGSSNTFNKCSEANATYFEILNIISAFTAPQCNATTEDALLQPELEFATHALHDGQLAVQQVHYARERDQLDFLASKTIDTALNKPEAAVDMLEVLPVVFKHHQLQNGVAASLGSLYVQICRRISSAEPRAVAMQNLADMMDSFLEEGRLTDTPSDDELHGLWKSCVAKPMNPTLQDAIIRLSGCIIATKTLRQGVQEGNLVADLQSWSAMIQDAGKDDKPFDTRFAAARSLQSFFAASRFSFSEPPSTRNAYLPVLVALYDALNDDDDEVREVASFAARPIFDNQFLMPLGAADRLLHHLCDSYGQLPEFHSLVTSRMICSPSWMPARDQLQQALHFDDALFAVEEQNLYIDEVRESRRWTGAYAALVAVSPGEAQKLVAWTVRGLDALLEHATTHDDGPMGWITFADVYAVCARVVLCAAAARKASGSVDIERRLVDLRALAEEDKFHGSLVDMLDH